MIIVCDVDGVLNNLMDVTLDIYNTKYGTSYTTKDVTSYNIEDCFEPEAAERIKDIFCIPGLWKKVKPVNGAQNGLQKLINAGHQVYIATDHNPNTYGEKVAWLKRFFPFIEPSKIICIKDKWMLRADAMIEDNLQALLAKPYYHRILVDHPWNQSTKDYVYDIHRCKNWNEIVNAVNKIDEEEGDSI